MLLCGENNMERSNQQLKSADEQLLQADKSHHGARSKTGEEGSTGPNYGELLGLEAHALVEAAWAAGWNMNIE